MIGSNDLRNRFDYHPPIDEIRKRDHEMIREMLFNTAIGIDSFCPDGREKSLAITKLEEAMFWANAAIARVT